MEHGISTGGLEKYTASLRNLLAGSGLRNRIICAAIFALCTIVYVWLLVPATRTSDIIYPGVSIEMRTVPPEDISETDILPGASVTQRIVGSGEHIVSVSVLLSCSEDQPAGMYRITIIGPDGTRIATDQFTTEHRSSPFQESVPLGGIEMASGDVYQFVLTAEPENEQTLHAAVISTDETDYPGMQTGDETEDEILLLSLVAEVDQAPAWMLAWIIIAAVCAAIMFWRAPLATNALVIILIFGVIFCFITPINDSPDETAHMASTFRLADGEWFNVPQTDDAISEMYSGSSGQTVHRSELKGVSWEEKPELGDAGADLIATGHIPQVLGVLFGRLLGLDLLGIYYAGRLFNMLFYSICAFIGVRMAPRFRLYLAVFSIMPMQISICSSYSSDGCIYGLAILAAGWFIRMYYEPSIRIGVSQLAVFALLMSLVCFRKYWAAPLGLLPFAVPSARFARRSVKVWCILPAVCTIAASAAGLWYARTHGAVGTVAADADIVRQAQFMIAAPVQSARIIAGSLASGLGNDLSQLFVFGRLTVRTPGLLVMIYIGFISVVAFSTTRYQHDAAYTIGNTPVRTVTRTWVLCIMILTVAAVYIVNYLTWTPVGTDTVIGVQGRYLIPILAYLPFLSFDSWPLVSRSVYMRSRTVSGLIGTVMLMASVMSLCFYAL